MADDGDQLARAVREANERWPGLGATVEAVREQVIQVTGEGGLDDRAASDLVLAAAALRGDGAAPALLLEHVTPVVRARLSSLRIDAATQSEVVQRLRVRLFVGGESGRPGLAHYAGRVELAGFVAIVAHRLALDLLAERDVLRPDEELLELRVEVPSVEDDAVRLERRRRLSRAMIAALDGLSSRHRLLLRLHLVDGLDPAALAGIYGVHRTTATRWLGEAFDQLRQVVHQLLGGHDQLALAELFDSQLELSLSRLLDG